MSPSEYEQLIQFLGPRFEAIDRRFEAIDRRFDELRAEILGHFDETYRRLEHLAPLRPGGHPPRAAGRVPRRVYDAVRVQDGRMTALPVVCVSKSR